MTERKPYPTDARNEEWGFVAPYLILFPLDAGQRRHDWRYVVGGDFGSVRNFVFEAVLGILALPRQGKNPQGSSRHRRNEAIRVQNGELIHRAFPMRHRPLPLRCDVA